MQGTTAVLEVTLFHPKAVEMTSILSPDIAVLASIFSFNDSGLQVVGGAIGKACYCAAS